VRVCMCFYKLSFNSSQHKSAVDTLPFHSSAVGCQKVTISYGDLPVRPICRRLISFYGATLKEDCLGTRSADLHSLKLRNYEERNAI